MRCATSSSLDRELLLRYSGVRRGGRRIERLVQKIGAWQKIFPGSTGTFAQDGAKAG